MLDMSDSPAGGSYVTGEHLTVLQIVLTGRGDAVGLSREKSRVVPGILQGRG
jgi:hypothetical protein